MLFSSLIFLLFFLPITFLSTRFLKLNNQNIFLLIASLVFYSWGEPIYIFLMLFSITFNWAMGLFIEKYRQNNVFKNIFTFIAIAGNLSVLFYFKYFNFFIDIITSVLKINSLNFTQVALPLGISFYTFQSISYIIDLYQGKCSLQKSWIKLSLYISFFPQLVAGPIIKYNDVDSQLTYREITHEKTAYGIKRFIYGLSKKVLISNYFGMIVDQIYGMQVSDISTALAWFVAVLYALQIYFDFSGYSDMAIGLGKVFGFDFPENFNYPYVSSSVQEFWRRWHISLSTWFKEYLYIPLGGNRKGKVRTYINLLIVFFCTGFWHGANLQFIVWGLFHGAFLILERVFLSKYLKMKKYYIFARIYTLLEIITSFVIFRAPGLRYGLNMIKTMLIYTKGNAAYPISRYVDFKVIIFLIIAILFCGIVQKAMPKYKNMLFNSNVFYKAELIYLLVLYFMCVVSLVSNTYNPFIYFRF